MCSSDLFPSHDTGSEILDADAEAKRVLPVIEAIHTRFPYSILSVDTYYSSVAAQAVAAGASMGGVVGAVIAVAAEAVTKSISLYQNMVDWTSERMEDNRAAQRAAERLGVVASGAGRRRY